MKKLTFTFQSTFGFIISVKNYSLEAAKKIAAKKLKDNNIYLINLSK